MAILTARELSDWIYLLDDIHFTILMTVLLVRSSQRQRELKRI